MTEKRRKRGGRQRGGGEAGRGGVWGQAEGGFPGFSMDYGLQLYRTQDVERTWVGRGGGALKGAGVRSVRDGGRGGGGHSPLRKLSHPPPRHSSLPT